MAITQKNIPQKKSPGNYWRMVKVTVLLLFPLVLLWLPATFFDGGQSLCLSMLLLDTACSGCGMTRAIMHLLHLDLGAALAFNKLSVLVLPLLVFLWAKTIYREGICLTRSL